VQENLKNITNAIEKGIITDSLIERTEQLENERVEVEVKLDSMQLLSEIRYSDVSYMITEWKSLERNTESFRSFVQQFIKEIRAFPHKFEIVLDVGLGVVDDFTETISVQRSDLYAQFQSKTREESLCLRSGKSDDFGITIAISIHFKNQLHRFGFVQIYDELSILIKVKS